MLCIIAVKTNIVIESGTFPTRWKFANAIGSCLLNTMNFWCQEIQTEASSGEGKMATLTIQHTDT